MKKWILNLLLLLLFFTSCRTKHLKIEKNEQRSKERKEVRKDSLFEEKKQVVLEAFAWEKSHAFEMEIQSDKDSLGNSKDFSIEKIRSPTSEKIIVRGGSLRFKVGSTDKQFLTKKDTFTTKKASLRTEIDDYKSSEKEDFKKEEDKKNTGFSFGFYFWLILILILLFLAWRLKLFRLFK